MRNRQAGNSFLILLVGLFVLLCVVIFYLAGAGHGGGLLGTGIPGLAGVAPADTCLLVGFDLRESKQFETMLGKLQAISKRPKVAEQLKQVKDEAGFSAEELVAAFHPNAVMVMFPLEGRGGLVPAAESQDPKPFEMGLAVGVRDEEKAKQLFDRALEKSKTKPTLSEEHGQQIFVVGAGPDQWAYHFGGGALFVTSGRGAMLRMLETAEKKKPALAENPVFKEALARVSVGSGSDATLLFINIKQALTGWEKDLAEGAATPDQVAGLNGLQYFVVGSTSHESGGFLKVDASSQSKLIAALTRAQSVPNGSARFVPASWGNYSSFNLPWLYANILELVRLTPGGQEGIDQFPAMLQANLGISLEDLFKALDGEIAVSSDAIELLQEVPAEKTDEQKKLEQHYGCITNEKNIATGLEMYATDFSGRYPESLGPLTPNYLKIIPNCPAAEKNTYSESYQMASQPDAYTFFCQGTYHIRADYPQYNAYEGLVDPDGAKVTAQGSPEPREPEPTFVLLLGVKDAELFNKIMDALLARAGTAGKELGTPIGETAVYVMPGGQSEWVLVSKPAPMAIFAFGPKPHQALEKALGASGKSVADISQYSATVARAGKNWVGLGYQDLGAIFKTFADELSDSPSPPEFEAELASVVQDVAKDIQDLKEASFVSVEADGIRLGGGGISGSVMLVGAVAGAVMVPNFARARGQGQLTACKSNEKNIATACEMYSTDYAGRYPANLGMLTPNYLRMIPECPAAGADTYSATYQVSASPDMFTLWCQGENHLATGTPPNYPQYNAMQGLIER